MRELLVAIDGSSVCHITREIKDGDWWQYGTALCGLRFYEREIVDESERRLCAKCKRIAEKAIADEIEAERIGDDAVEKLEAVQG